MVCLYATHLQFSCMCYYLCDTPFQGQLRAYLEADGYDVTGVVRQSKPIEQQQLQIRQWAI